MSECCPEGHRRKSLKNKVKKQLIYERRTEGTKKNKSKIRPPNYIARAYGQGLLQLQACVYLEFYKRAADFYE